MVVVAASIVAPVYSPSLIAPQPPQPQPIGVSSPIDTFKYPSATQQQSPLHAAALDMTSGAVVNNVGGNGVGAPPQTSRAFTENYDLKEELGK
jgi:hypothetical protein